MFSTKSAVFLTSTNVYRNPVEKDRYFSLSLFFFFYFLSFQFVVKKCFYIISLHLFRHLPFYSCYILTGETQTKNSTEVETNSKTGAEVKMEDPICITLEYYRLACTPPTFREFGGLHGDQIARAI